MASKPKRPPAPQPKPSSQPATRAFLLLLAVLGIALLIWSQVGQRSKKAAIDSTFVANTNIVATVASNVPAQTNVDTVLPNDPVQLINYGTQLLEMGEFAKAVQLYAKALELNPDDEEGHFGLAVAYTRMGQTNEAIKHYEDALKIFPDYSEAHNNLGNLYLGRGEIDKAIQHYLSAIKVQPEYTSAINNLGRALAQQGKIEQAFHHFEQAVSLDTNYFEARFNLATALMRLGRSAEAAIEFKEVLRQKPGFKPAEQMLARLQQMQSTNKP